MDKSLNTGNLKKINQNKVFSYIYKNKKVSKHMICDDLNMCLSTVNSNLRELEGFHLIKKDGYYESTGGRKADQIIINQNYKFTIGIAILSNKVHFVLTNLYAEIVYKDSLLTTYIDDDEYYENVSKYLNKFISNNNINEKDILGVSIATQGIVIDNKVVYGDVINNNGMTITKFKKFINFDIHLEHDSKCAAELAMWNIDISNGFVFLLNNNLGSAVIVNNSIISGYSGTIEHFNISTKKPCYCGKIGCLETICSVNSLQKTSNLDIDDFFKLLREKDNFISSIWDEYISSLAFVISNISLVLDGKFIFSGKLSSYLTSEDIILLHSKISTFRSFKFDCNNIVIHDSGEFTQAIGSTLYFIKKFINNI